MSRHTLSHPSYSEWSAPLREAARRTLAWIHSAVDWLPRRLARVSPNRWFLLAFVILFLAFFAILAIQPSSVGRGGR
jgi:hypothetical protein